MKEVFYDKDMAHYDICRESESPDCSNQFTVTASVGDHTGYFGVQIGQASVAAPLYSLESE